MFQNYYKTVLASIICLLFISLTSIYGDSKNKAKITYDYKTYDLKQVPHKSKKSCKFYYKNEGSAPLVILGYETSCGCTKVAYNKKPLKSGGTDSLTVSFDGKDAGAFYKKIKIKTNSSVHPDTLIIKGIVVQ